MFLRQLESGHRSPVRIPSVCAFVAILIVSLSQLGSASRAGGLLWQDRVSLLTVGLPQSAVTDMAMANGVMFAVGYGPYSRSSTNHSNILVRAYAPRSGALVWDDVWDATDYADVAHGIAAEADVVVAVGSGDVNFETPYAARFQV